MRKIFMIIMFLLMLLVSSCAAAPGGNMDYEPEVDLSPGGSKEEVDEYYSFHVFNMNNTQYRMLLPEDSKAAIRYYYTVRSEVTTLSDPKINMVYKVEYIKSSDISFDSMFYTLLAEVLPLIQKEIPNATINIDGFKEEVEFRLSNPDNVEIRAVLIEYYYPIKLVETNTSKMIMVYIPIYKDMLVKKANSIQTIDKSEFISLEEFYSNPRLYQKNNK